MNMNVNQWIEIKPGCEMPNEGERVIARDKSYPYFVNFEKGQFWFQGQMWTSATHWMRLSVPDKPDPFETWFKAFPSEQGYCGYRFIDSLWISESVARQIWNAAIASTKQTP